MRVGEEVKRGQTLIRFYLPTLEQQLRRQEKDLAELIRINADLDRRDLDRLVSAGHLRDTALAKLKADRRRFEERQSIHDQKVADFRHLARREVVAPLARRGLLRKSLRRQGSNAGSSPRCSWLSIRPSFYCFYCSHASSQAIYSGCFRDKWMGSSQQ